jgi:hypothetical protein
MSSKNTLRQHPFLALKLRCPKAFFIYKKGLAAAIIFTPFVCQKAVWVFGSCYLLKISIIKETCSNCAAI